MILTLLYNFVLLLVAGVCIAFTGLYIFFKLQYSHWGKKGVPYSKPSFPFGNFGEAQKKSLTVILRELYNEGRDHRFYGTWQFHKPNLMINDIDLVKKILVGDFMSFHDHGVYLDEENDPISGNKASSI